MRKAWYDNGTKSRKSPRGMFWTSFFFVLTSRFWPLGSSTVASTLNLNAHTNTWIHTQSLWGSVTQPLGVGLCGSPACCKQQRLPGRYTVIASQPEKSVLLFQNIYLLVLFLTTLFSWRFPHQFLLHQCRSEEGFPVPAVAVPAPWSKPGEAAALVTPALPHRAWSGCLLLWVNWWFMWMCSAMWEE